MSNITQQGVINSNNFYESNAMNEYSGTDGTYTPTTGTNSCIRIGSWMVPETAVTGDMYRLKCDVYYSGFDTSNTSGTFDIWWQGAVYNKEAGAWQWAGNNPITTTLNTTIRPKTIVLNGGSYYHYDCSFSLPANNVTTYTGMNIGLRSDYSNGSGTITLRNFKVIPEKYSVTDTGSKTNMRIGNFHIANNEIIEW